MDKTDILWSLSPNEMDRALMKRYHSMLKGDTCYVEKYVGKGVRECWDEGGGLQFSIRRSGKVLLRRWHSSQNFKWVQKTIQKSGGIDFADRCRCSQTWHYCGDCPMHHRDLVALLSSIHYIPIASLPCCDKNISRHGKMSLGRQNRRWLRGKEAWAMFSKSDKEGGLPRVEWTWGIHRRQGQWDDGGTPTQGPGATLRRWLFFCMRWNVTGSLLVEGHPDLHYILAASPGLLWK